VTETRATSYGPGVEEVHVLWISEGMSCDGDSVSVTAASLPSIEDVLLGNIPGLPQVHLHNKVLDPSVGGEDFLQVYRQAANDELDVPFVLVIEGSIPNENINGDGYWTSFGNDPATGEPLTLNWWIDQLAPRAWAVVAVGTCATYGGIHAMAGNPTGCMGLADYLGWDFRSSAGIPIVNIPGCPVQPDNFMETLTWLLYQAAGMSPMIPLDDQLRPTWLFGKTVHEGCDRAAYYEQGDFALDYNSPKCQVKIGCWGPVVNCNITERGAVGHMGGCMVSGGVCIGCTMPGFPDKFTPFYVTPPGSRASTMMSKLVGSFVRPLRRMTQLDRNREKRWDESKAVPSGWSLDYDTTSLSHQVAEFFYDKLQYFGSTRPGRKKKETQYNSGWTTPAESAYGEAYQKLPADREKLAREKGLRRRSELKGPPREAAVRKDS
jgi:hydrogenase small subunit